MTKHRKKSLRLWSALLLFMALMIPQLAFAYTVSGDPANPSLTIHKFEQEPNTEPGEEGTGLPGQNAKGKAVSGVQYTLTMTHRYNAQEDKWEPGTSAAIVGTTGSDGTITFTKADGLELGRYEVAETDGPDHIILNPKTFAVDVPMTNKEGTALNYNVHIYPKNETIRSDVELQKFDENGDALPGVKFKLYNNDGSPAVDNEDNAVPELTTNSDGVINVSGLAAGKYYFQETAVPYGYALNTTKIGFTVQKTGENGQEIEVVWDNVDRFAKNGKVTNYVIPTVDKDAEGKKQIDVDRNKVYSYNITIHTPKNIDQYDALIVTDVLDSRLTFVGNVKLVGAPEGSFTFTQDGQTLKWTANDPSQLTRGQDIKITFDAKIKPDAMLTPGETGIPNTVKLDFDNSFGWRTINDPTAPPEDPETPPVVTPTQGGLQVIKVDASDNTVVLSGAEFKLTSDEAGNNIIDTSAMGNVVEVNKTVYNGLLENLTTGNDGKFEISGLTPGTYYLHETKAPTYTGDDKKLKSYRLLTKPIDFEVLNKDIAKLKVENSKSAWALPTTGGLGTTLFTGVGLLLMMSASVLFMRRRQSESTED